MQTAALSLSCGDIFDLIPFLKTGLVTLQSWHIELYWSCNIVT